MHRAVIESGVKVTGCTVHFVDDSYDNGPIILQRVVPVLEGDTAESLAARVFKEECKALPDAITQYAEGRLVLKGRRVSVKPPTLDRHAPSLTARAGPGLAGRSARGLQTVLRGDADQLAPVASAVADQVDHPGPALGLVFDKLRPKTLERQRPWTRLARKCR